MWDNVTIRDATRPWVMKMVWHDLLFMHWPIPAEVLRPHVPSSLEIDRFDGRAWIGVVPFRMTGVGPRFLPRSLGSAFPEVNVRTYVRHNEKSGVWFFSLDAANRLAVWGAKRFFHLPYHHAEISVASNRGIVEYSSRRIVAPEVQLTCRYNPTGVVEQAAPGSLKHWLTERYCLFASSRRGDLFRGDIHHEPWPLQSAEAEVEINAMVAPLGIVLSTDRPLLHFAKRLDVLAWPLERVTGLLDSGE